jgi:hypothetical protein
MAYDRYPDECDDLSFGETILYGVLSTVGRKLGREFGLVDPDILHEQMKEEKRIKQQHRKYEERRPNRAVSRYEYNDYTDESASDDDDEIRFLHRMHKANEKLNRSRGKPRVHFESSEDEPHDEMQVFKKMIEEKQHLEEDEYRLAKHKDHLERNIRKIGRKLRKTMIESDPDSDSESDSEYDEKDYEGESASDSGEEQPPSKSKPRKAKGSMIKVIKSKKKNSASKGAGRGAGRGAGKGGSDAGAGRGRGRRGKGRGRGRGK